jgi:N-methylhydantoinase A/oxoprolinase/acetone carboxylase beta subunit
VGRDGQRVTAASLDRASLAGGTEREGPLLVLDAEATTFIPDGWTARLTAAGSILLERSAYSPKIRAGGQ